MLTIGRSPEDLPCVLSLRVRDEDDTPAHEARHPLVSPSALQSKMIATTMEGDPEAFLPTLWLSRLCIRVSMWATPILMLRVSA